MTLVQHGIICDVQVDGEVVSSEGTDHSREGRWRAAIRSTWAVAVVVVVVAVPVGIVWWLTGSGLGVTPDGAVYLGVAANIADGKGVTSPVSSMVDSIPPADAAGMYGETPLIRWPPGYPVMLGVGSWTSGTSPADVARLVALVALGASAVLTMVLARRWTGSLLVGGGAALLVVAEPYHLLLHSVVSTEPVYTAASLACVAAADNWWRNRSVAWLGGAAAAAGAAWLFRFSGVAVVAALAVAVLVHSRHRLRDLAVVGAASLPALGWMAVTEMSPYRESHRETRPLPRAEIDSMLQTVNGWITSASDSTLVRDAVVVALVAAAVAGVVALRGRALLAATIIGMHLAVVVGSAVFVRRLPVGGRMLMPIQPLVICLAAAGFVAVAANLIGRVPAARARDGSVVAAGIAILAVAALQVTSSLDSLQPAAPPFQSPRLDATLAALPGDIVVFSNNATATWQLTGRPTVNVPSREWQESGAENEGYGEQLAELVGLVEEGRAVVVFHHSTTFFNEALVTPAEVDGPGLDNIEVEDGVVVMSDQTGAT